MITINVVFFGQLEDVTACKTVAITEVSTTTELKEKLHQQFPKLANFKYLLAHNQEITNDNRELKATDELALLPPFAGG